MMQFKVRNKIIACACCQNNTFGKDYRQLNSRGATFFGFDWANRNATVLICRECSHIMWFAHEPQQV